MIMVEKPRPRVRNFPRRVLWDIPFLYCLNVSIQSSSVTDKQVCIMLMRKVYNNIVSVEIAFCINDFISFFLIFLPIILNNFLWFIDE